MIGILKQTSGKRLDIQSHNNNCFDKVWVLVTSGNNNIVLPPHCGLKEYKYHDSHNKEFF